MSKKTLNKIRLHLNVFEQIISRIIHNPIIAWIFIALEKFFFRSTPLYFGFVITIVTGVLMLAIAYFFGYQVTSLTVFGYIFALGFVIGFVYEYLRSLVKQVK